jgi:hypothetical protein
MSSLFLAEMSVDRLLAVRFPMSANRWCTTKRAKVTVVMTSLALAAVNTHVVFAFKYTEDLKAGMCYVVDI